MIEPESVAPTLGTHMATIHLDPDQQKALESLTLSRGRWRWVRWLHLVAGGLAMLGSVPLSLRMIGVLSEALGSGEVDGFKVLLSSMTAVGVAQSCLLGLVGAVLFVRALMRWRGAPHDILLLALFERGGSEPGEG